MGRLREKFEWPVRVYYEDTDAGGVVYHANYLRFMERARNEWLRAMGHPVEQILERDNKLFVVRSVTMKFIAPARLGDDLRISAQPVEVKRASMQVRQTVRRAGDDCDRLLVSADIELAMVDSENFRPTRLSRFIGEAWGNLTI